MLLDYLIVGAGLTGAVIARLLTDAKERVLVVDRRQHVGGNIRDRRHPSGIRIHTYGPHYFRTVSDDIWAFVNRFAKFFPYEACIKARIRGSLENWPIAASYVQRVVGEGWQPEFRGEPTNFEEAALALMPRIIYETFVKEYNEKQWGVNATALAAELCKRFDVRLDGDPRLTPNAKHQGIPVNGYSDMIEQILRGIPVVLNFDYLKEREAFRPRKRTVFTGPIDEFFRFSLGKLKYRGQLRTDDYYPDLDRFQATGQVNEPLHETGALIRTLEWKHMMEPGYASRIRGTVVTRETPVSPADPDGYEYPFPDNANKSLYRQYAKLASEVPDVVICGRLGDYRYYDMDHAIARAMQVAKGLLLTGQSRVELPTRIG